MKRVSLLKELTTTEISGCNPKEWLVAWPIASLEQHGPYLPLGTDTIVLDYIVGEVRKRLNDRIPIMFIPTLALGKSPEHLNFPGTISLRAKTLLDIMEDVVSSLITHGFNHLVVLNGHGGNTDILHAMGPDLRYKYGIYIYYIDLWGDNFFGDIIQKMFPKLTEADVHAASAETSMLLYIRPDLVTSTPTGRSLEKASKQSQIDIRRFSWLTEDVSQSGVIGDPSYASAEAGRQIVEYAVKKMCSLLEQFYRDVNP